MTTPNADSVRVQYRRVEYPACILGDKADYEIVVDGEIYGFARVDRHSRSSGTNTRWEAYRSDGHRIAYGRPRRSDLTVAVKADVALTRTTIESVESVVTFTTNHAAAVKIVAALDAVLGVWSPMTDEGQDRVATLSAFRTEFAGAAQIDGSGS